MRLLAAEIMAMHAALPLETVRLLLESEKGYLTPKVDVRAVVFNEEGQVLLVQERADGAWALPGGWADVGESPGEIAAREVLEESGYLVRPVKLLAVLDKAKHRHPPDIWYVYKLFIRCALIGGEPRESLETSGVGFFSQENLPPLSTGRVTVEQIYRLFEHRDRPDLPADFD